MTSVDATALGSNGGDEDDAAPVALDHVREGELAEEEGRAEVDVEHLVELVEADV